METTELLKISLAFRGLSDEDAADEPLELDEDDLDDDDDLDADDADEEEASPSTEE
jgi:hypothetical protein